ncbi:DUF1810 family protein [Chthoniobacter flavus]|uniref:DUF1810 family protein n=1 Tax=Chthoniobacter flavus TaxID=191863 RepID=UPI00192B8FB4
MSLERFHQAQASQWSGYATALAETRAGRKSSHWIWYIFPQIDGLGRSSPRASTRSRLGRSLRLFARPVASFALRGNHQRRRGAHRARRAD